MTGMTLLRQVYSLMKQPKCLTDEDGCESGLLAVNQIYAELWPREHREPFVPLENLGEPVELSGRCLPALTYGTAMLLCLDGEKNIPYDRYYELYQRTAAQIGGIPGRRTYTLPIEEVTA